MYSTWLAILGGNYNVDGRFQLVRRTRTVDRPKMYQASLGKMLAQRNNVTTVNKILGRGIMLGEPGRFTTAKLSNAGVPIIRSDQTRPRIGFA